VPSTPALSALPVPYPRPSQAESLRPAARPGAGVPRRRPRPGGGASWCRPCWARVWGGPPSRFFRWRRG